MIESFVNGEENKDWREENQGKGEWGHIMYMYKFPIMMIIVDLKTVLIKYKNKPVVWLP